MSESLFQVFVSVYMMGRVDVQCEYVWGGCDSGGTEDCPLIARLVALSPTPPGHVLKCPGARLWLGLMVRPAPCVAALPTLGCE